MAMPRCSFWWEGQSPAETLLSAGPRPGEKAESPALLVPWLSKAGSLTNAVSHLCTPVSAALGLR